MRVQLVEVKPWACDGKAAKSGDQETRRASHDGAPEGSARFVFVKAAARLPRRSGLTVSCVPLRRPPMSGAAVLSEEEGRLHRDIPRIL